MSSWLQTMKYLDLIIVVLLGAHSLTKASESECTGLQLHTNGNGTLRSLGWLVGKNHVNLLLSSKTNFEATSLILTGGSPKTDAAKDACIKVTWKMNFAQGRFDFAIHGFKAIAAYECSFSGKNGKSTETNETTGNPSVIKNDQRMCQPGQNSTNIDWANKLDPGKPITILTDEKTYALDVRCPKGKERLWYVKSINKTLDPTVKEIIMNKVKEVNLEYESPVELNHENCPDP